MKTETGAAYQAVRCPQCNLLPEVKIESLDTVILVCAQHGHMAQGQSLNSATANWNQYISFVRKAA